MTDRQKRLAREQAEEIDAKLQHSDAVVLSKGQWAKLKRCVDEVCDG